MVKSAHHLRFSTALRRLALLSWTPLACSLLACTSTPTPTPRASDTSIAELPERSSERAVALLETGDLATAEEILVELQGTEPDNPSVALLLGRVFFEGERFSEAIDQFQNLVRLDDEVALHHLWLGRALGEHVQRVPSLQRLPLARRLHDTFRRAVELDPESAEAHLALARFYSEAPAFAGGNRALAQTHAERLIQLDPPRGHLRMGLILENWGRADEAREHVLAALDAGPETVETWRDAGLFFERQGSPEKARSLLEKAVELDPDDEIARQHLAGL